MYKNGPVPHLNIFPLQLFESNILGAALTFLARVIAELWCSYVSCHSPYLSRLVYNHVFGESSCTLQFRKASLTTPSCGIGG